MTVAQVKPGFSTAAKGAAPDEIAAPTPVVLHLLDRGSEALVIVALVGELALVLANVIDRIFFNQSFLWADEVARLALSVLAFVGGAVAYRRREHAFVQVVMNLFPDRGRRACLALADVTVVFVCVLTGLAAVDFITSSWGEVTPILRVPAPILSFPLLLGLALMTFYALRTLRGHGATAVGSIAGFVAAVAILVVTRDIWMSWLGDDAAIIAALGLFLVAILAGVPVGFVLLLSTLTYLWASGAATFVVLPQTMVHGTGNFILLAVPFFILAGLVMERGGISLRLVRFVQAVVGHMRGGLLQVTVGSMYVISGLSGSKPADVAAVGTVMRDELRDQHGAPEGAAALAAAAVMGETIPPSIAMLIVGSITSVSVGALFIGGLIPAAVIALCLMVLIYVRARAAGAVRRPRPPLSVILRAGRQAILPVLMPAALLTGILLGVATPTEIAALAVVYGVALSALVYREMSWQVGLRVALDAAALTGVLLFIFAAASSFSWTLTIALLPQRLVTLLQSSGGSTTVFMLGSIVLLIIVGVLLEGLPSLNVLAPLLIPIAGRLGLSELHYALVLIIAMGIGGFMPFAGIGFYVCCAIMRCDIEAASRAMLPYLLVLLLGLLLVAFLPSLTLTLPHYFGFRG